MDFTPDGEAERLRVLLEIDSELESSDVAALKFLCRDIVPQKHLERVCDGRGLFAQLEDQALLGDDFLIVGELLHTIQRMDLLRLLKFNSAEFEQSLQDRGGPRVSPYRKMLYKLSEDVTEKNLRRIKFLLKLPKSRLEPSATFLDVLVTMEKQEKLSEDSLGVLEEACASVDKQLAVRLQEFAEQRAACRGPGRESSVQSYTDSSPHLSLPGDGRPQPPDLQPQPQEASVPEPNPSGTSVDGQLSVDTVSESTSMEVYRMQRRPRGHCVIINNYSFEEAGRRHPELRLGNRDGTDADVEALREVFSWLHFTVHVRGDLTRAELLAAVEEFGSEAHGQLDAFACCVLSHGRKGSVYGTDGEPASIRQLTQPFTSSRCPSLAGKPKLFFIQACQALEEEPPRLQADGPGDAYHADAGPPRARPQDGTIPNDSDFLLGMATVEYQKSYRHTRSGSAFIQQLCEQLKQGCPRNEDILAIMTRVNRNVSAASFGRFKQMPEPRYTLTKKLVLSVD